MNLTIPVSTTVGHENLVANAAYSYCCAWEATITAALTLSAETQTSMQPRAIGLVSVSCKPRDGRTVLDRLHQQGSMRMLFPRASGNALTGVVLNTAGGTTGGDRFNIRAKVAPDCHMVLTTQAAERAYRAQPNEVAHLVNHITVGQRGRFDWLPQETLIYDGSALRRSLRIDLGTDARLLAVEPVIFGRTEMGEVLNHIMFRDRIDIRRDGQLVFADRTFLNGDASAKLRNAAIGGGCGAMASVVLAAPEAEQFLAPVRALMPTTGGVSLIRDGLLFARLMAVDGFTLRQSLVPMIELLSAAPIPKTWMI